MTRPPRNILFCDIEVYLNYFLVAFRRFGDAKTLTFELSDRSTIDLDRLRSILLQNRIVTFNGMSFDVPLIVYALTGATNAQLKLASDRIINGGVKYWDVEALLGITIPRFDLLDLIEPQPNAWASLKTLNGRLHGKRMQDLPIEPDAILTHAEMDLTTDYCINSDLPATERLFEALKGPLELREALSTEYRQNFLCKSDSQIGEAILRRRVEELTGQKIERVTTPPGTSFNYKVPPYMRFQRPDLAAMLEKLRETEFYVRADGKIDLPPFLQAKTVAVGETTYAMGIGGLHSTESNRAVHSDEQYFLVDFDVASYYPAIILGSGLYPKAMGPQFLDVYRKIRDERVEAKRRAKEIEKVDLPALRLLPAGSADQKKHIKTEYLRLQSELQGCTTKAEGLKISLNGVFGKLGSRYSLLYAPHLMIAVTLTGQLALLMLIERAENAGIPVVSGNTDGVVFRCPRHREADLMVITKQWEADTGFELESTRYLSLYSQSVNSYIAVKEDGKTKLKGPLSNPRAENDMRSQLMHNPNAAIVSIAVQELIVHGTPIEETIHRCTDIRDFVTVVNVKGGGTWRGGYLGKVVRYVWSTDGDVILYKTPHPSTGNFKKVPKSDGCHPMMELPDEFPTHLIDYDRYVAEAQEVLMNIGYTDRPPAIKPLRLLKRHAWAWFALAAA